jgi:NAD-dependent dihydropyrimidine dehydrogenase PreA subunit
MPKILEAKDPRKCNGCELCALESQRQNKLVGLEGSLIRVFRETNKNQRGQKYSIEIDPRTAAQDVEKISEICPKGVFEIHER